MTRATLAVHAAILLALPLALTLALPDWYFASPNGIDPWLYNGFFRHLHLYNTLFPNTYYGTRLGWILPGHAAYAIFEAETAAFVLHVTAYLIAVVALYCVVRWITDSRLALGCAMAFGLFMPSARGLGDDYAAAGVVAYALASMAFAVASCRFAWYRLLSFCSGFAAGAMFHSNIVAAFLFPTVLVWMVPFSRNPSSWRRAAMQLGAWAAGVGVCTLLLGVASVWYGGSFLFFVPSFTWMMQNSATNPWDQRGLAWVLTAPWALVPTFTALACGITLLQRHTRARLDAGHLRALAAFGYIVGLFLIWDFLGSAAVFYWPFYTSWLMPVSFVALAAIVVGTRLPGPFDGLALALSAGILLVSLARPDLIKLPFGVAGVAVSLAAMTASGWVPKRSIAVLLITLFLAHMNLWASVTGFFSPKEPRKDVFRTVDAALRYIEPYTTKRQPRFLYSEKDPVLASHYNAIAGIYLWAYTIATRNYPAIDAQGAQILPAGTVATVLSRRPEPLEAINTALAPHHLAAEIVSIEQVVSAAGPLYLTMFRTLDGNPPKTDGYSQGATGSP